MGAFQAIAAGLGKGGEDMATGQIAAQKEQLRVQDVMHNWQMDYIKSNLAQQASDTEKERVKNSYDIALKQNDLYHQQLISQGWRDMGVTRDSKGAYTRTFQNLTSGESKQLPIQGTPPDSPEGLQNYFRSLQGLTDDKGRRVFSDVEAGQIAFKTPQLYRDKGPAGVYENFLNLAGSLGDRGIGGYDTPDKQKSFAQKMYDEWTGKGSYFRYMAGGGGFGRDLTGFTAGEKREYDAYAKGLDTMKQDVMRLFSAQIGATLDPQQQQALSGQAMMMIQSINQQEQNKFNEVQGRRNPGAAGGTPNMQFWSKSAYQAANKAATPAQIKAAEDEARTNGAFIFP